MYLPSDRAYKSTKKIIKGRKRLDQNLRELIEWIKEELNLNALAVFYTALGKREGPRLHVILETSREYSRVSTRSGYDRKIQTRISAKFIEIMEKKVRRGVPQPFNDKINGKNLWIMYSHFDTVAMNEAHDNVDKKAIKRLINKYGLWTISAFSSSVTVMYYTDQEIESNRQSGLSDKLRSEYLKLLEPHDEFGYCSKNTTLIYFDSKENFDDKYEGNWFYYYK